MDKGSIKLDYIPLTISSSFLFCEPTETKTPEPRAYFSEIFKYKIRGFNKKHRIEKYFSPYSRASGLINPVKFSKKKILENEFDISHEEQNKFLYGTPKNSKFKISKFPESDYFFKAKNSNKSSFLSKSRKKISKLPPITDDSRIKSNFSLIGSYLMKNV